MWRPGVEGLGPSRIYLWFLRKQNNICKVLNWSQCIAAASDSCQSLPTIKDVSFHPVISLRLLSIKRASDDHLILYLILYTKLCFITHVWKWWDLVMENQVRNWPSVESVPWHQTTRRLFNIQIGMSWQESLLSMIIPTERLFDLSFSLAVCEVWKTHLK